MAAVIAQQAPNAAPATPPVPAETSAPPILQSIQDLGLDNLGWVDITALGVLLVFFVMGLFKGLIWQVSRIAILISAYFVAGRFGHDVAELIGRKEPAANPLGTAATETGSVPVGTMDVDTTLYLAYCLLFVGVLIVLSLVAMLVRRLAHKAGLGFFDRLGGGVLGIATGACVVLAGVFGVNMFFPQSELARAASESHSMRFSQQAIDMIGANADLRAVLHVDDVEGQAPGQLPGMPESGGGSDPSSSNPGGRIPGGSGAAGSGTTGSGMPGPGPRTGGETPPTGRRRDNR